MKKLYSLLFVAALLLTVLTGCQSAGSAANQPTQQVTLVPDPTVLQTNPAVSQPVPAETVISMITAENAIDIAIKDAGLKKEDVRDLDAELYYDNGDAHYDVDFEKDDQDYDYEIHAETGKILKKDVPAKAAAASASTAEKPTQISRNDAKNIALKHAGFTASQVTDLEVELDRDDGVQHYDVSFDANGYDYDYEINAASGKILRSEKERD